LILPIYESFKNFYTGAGTRSRQDAPVRVSSFYGEDGRRIVGFDKERGKGDRCHLDGDEHPYMFTTTDALLSDFRKEIIKRRKKP